MSASIDDRLRVRFGSVADAKPDEALLVEGEAPVPADLVTGRFRVVTSRLSHNVGCTCCSPRGPVAEALGRLFLARARGEVVLFRSVVAVVATAAGKAAVRAALAEDQLSAGRFRLSGS
jgi:hypothetical protein